MGMTCQLRAVAPEEVRRQQATPVDVDTSSESSVSLEKAWHGLHFLLTGSTGPSEWPLGFLLHGGQTVTADKPGDRLFSPEQTKDLGSALDEVSDARLWERFDPTQMTDEFVYPMIWDEPEDDLRNEYLGYFRSMKGLIHRASATGSALVVSIS